MERVESEKDLHSLNKDGAGKAVGKVEQSSDEFIKESIEDLCLNEFDKETFDQS